MPSPTWRRYLRFWRRDVDADLDAEFRFHVDAEVEYLVARGWSAEAARDHALRGFGDVDAFRRACRAADERRMARAHRNENFSVLLQDLRFALRSLRRQPAFTAIAILTLALGIGANTAIFSVINGVMLKPLPYREPQQLVMLWETRPGGDRPLISWPNYLDWRQRQRSFEDIAVYNPFASFIMTGQGDARATHRADGRLARRRARRRAPERLLPVTLRRRPVRDRPHAAARQRRLHRRRRPAAGRARVVPRGRR
jgi:hypothetical protein